MDPLPQKSFIHLLGKTGVAKSSTGNAFLGQEVFPYESSDYTVRDEIQIETAKTKRGILKVVDGPGLVDENTVVNNASIQAYKRVVKDHVDSVHYFVLIWRYADPILYDDRAMIQALKKQLGPNVIRNHGIIAITSRYVTEKEVISFEALCEGQTGTFSEVLEECGGRALLIDNKQPMADRHSEALKTLTSLEEGIDPTSATGMSLFRRSFISL